MMARQARKKSQSGIYHIMLRGINKQIIFYDEQDYIMFIKALQAAKKVSDFDIYAYCIMNNHVHLLIKENEEALGTVMKRIACKFVYWYNLKYERVGHLFQDRYRSEPVESDAYFLSVLRYIHQNPVKAGIVSQCKEYDFSSYNWYFKDSKLINKEFAFGIMKKEQFIAFHNEEEKRSILDIEEQRKKISDEKAHRAFITITGCQNQEQFKKFEREKKKEYGKQLLSIGLSIRQIVECTGLSKGWVESIK